MLGGEFEPPTKFSKVGGGLARSQFLEGVNGIKGGGVTFFRERLQFSNKYKLKSEIKLGDFN